MIGNFVKKLKTQSVFENVIFVKTKSQDYGMLTQKNPHHLLIPAITGFSINFRYFNKRKIDKLDFIKIKNTFFYFFSTFFFL